MQPRASISQFKNNGVSRKGAISIDILKNDAFALATVAKRYTGSRQNALIVQNRDVQSRARTSSKKMVYEENEPYR